MSHNIGHKFRALLKVPTEVSVMHLGQCVLYAVCPDGAGQAEWRMQAGVGLLVSQPQKATTSAFEPPTSFGGLTAPAAT
jgi:hypothetical protein